MKSNRVHSLRVALVQMNATVGALKGNAERIAEFAQRAAGAGADLIVFPELALSGYPLEGLVRMRDFLDDCAATLRDLVKALPREPVIVVGAPLRERREVFNAGFIFQGGRLRGAHRKLCLSRCDALEERDLFSAGTAPTVLNLGALRVGVAIAEDVTEPSVCATLRAAGVDAVVHLAASVYHRGTLKARAGNLARAARGAGAPLVHINLVGGQDELIFDGASTVFDSTGRVLARAHQFSEETLFAEISLGRKKPARTSKRWNSVSVPFPSVGNQAESLALAGGSSVAGPATNWKNRRFAVQGELEEVYSALKLAVRDYVEKNGFSKVVMGLSGGVDSALAAAICVDALGPDRVVGVTMPSRYTSDETLGDALQLAKNLGMEVHTFSIQKLHQAYLDEFMPLWPGQAGDTTEENFQARIRANAVMALSNKFRWLTVTTGNRSELATGYCTLYGDMAGGFALLKDVPKTMVWALSRWRNAGGEVIPVSTIERAPSAELRANQKDQDTLPPYDVLDGIIERYAERGWSVNEIVADGFEEATVRRVLRMIHLNEYKRRQSAPGATISPWIFAPGRRLPMTHHYGKPR